MYGMGFIINSYIFGSGASYLVDTYSPTVAFDLRKISSSATNCIRVRRSSDNAEQDIGFVGNDLDTASLSSFVGANNGFVVKWYNQGTGGATYDASQTVGSGQPLIVSSGTIITEGGKPTIQNDNGTDQNCILVMANYLDVSTLFTVAKLGVLNTTNYLTYSNTVSGGGFYYGGTAGGVNGLGGYDGTNVRNITGEDTNRHLGYFNMRSSKLYVSKDGASETDTGTFNSYVRTQDILGRRTGTILTLRGNGQTFILFNTDESANKTAIETEINNYYTIY